MRVESQMGVPHMFAVFLRLVVSVIWSVAVLGNLKFTDTVVLGRLNCWELEKGVGVFD